MDYIRICKISEVLEKKGMKFTLDDDTEIVIFNVNGIYYAVANTCPHNQSHVMHEGFVDNELYVTCPVHGYRFSLKTGMVPPDNKEMSGKLEIYKTKIENGELYVEKKKKKLRFFDWKW
jgi:nitrite reductase/ring-hydroxylating ferredoxin subunit